MSLPSSRFVTRYDWRGRCHLIVNGKRLDVDPGYCVVVDLHEEFPPRSFSLGQWQKMDQYRHDMNYAHDPNYRIMVDRWKKKTT